MLGSPLPDRGAIARRRALDRRRQIRRRFRQPVANRRQLMLRLLMGVIALVFLAIAGSLFVFDQAYKGRIMPNVTVRGLTVSEMQPVEAHTALAQQYNNFLETPLTFEFEGRTWQPSLEDLGVTLAIDDAVQQAYSLGRGLDMSMSLLEIAAIWQEGVEVPLHVTVDQTQLHTYLLELAQTINTPPQDATLNVELGQVRATRAQTGRQLLVDATMHETLAALQSLEPQTLTIRTRTLRPIIEDVHIAEAQQQLNALLQDGMTLRYGEQAWDWTPAEIGTLVQIYRVSRPEGDGEQVTVALDQRQMRHWVEAIAAEINTPAVEPRLRFTASGLQIIREGRNGAQLEIEQAVDQLAAALWQPERSLELPVTVLQPGARPETLASLGIVELVGQGRSSFLNSAPYRVTNIQAGASRMNGVLIPPGEEFSFNATVGAIDESNGFTQGYAIINGRTQQEWGGGVCQVSTTVFRSAFWAGVPITERNQHSFRITWYEQFEPIGMDAAIFTGPGGYDLRFVNDTGNWLLLEAYANTDAEVMVVNLYGTDPGREVIQTPPEITRRVPPPSEPRYVNDASRPVGTLQQTDVAQGGMDVQVGRVVKASDGTVLYQDTFFSRFKPWPNIFVRGTG